MCKTINRVCFTFLLSLLSLSIGAIAQTAESKQQINQAVFNKIEYHFNSQETDSIYAMAGEKFRSSLSLQAFQTVMTQQMYPLGQIQSAELISYEKEAGTYKLNFISTPLQLILSLDSLNKIETFLFQPYSPPKVDSTTPTSSTGTAATKFDRFVDSVALSYSRRANTHALAIGVINNGKTSSYYYGETQKGNKQLPDENTLFEVGSITKIFTATLLAYSVQRQSVGLDDNITRFLPDSVASNPSLQNITLKQLANHTSGLPRLPDNLDGSREESPSDPYAGYTQAQLYTYLKTYKAEIPPDSTYLYSNLGYGLLGDILVNISGKSYNELVQEMICDTLEMRNTTVSPDADTQHLARAYDENGKETAHWTFNDAMAGAGALKSTVFDLLRFARAHFKLPETDLENALALTRQFTFFTPPDTDIGLGWHMNLAGGNLVYRHTGNTSGSSSFIALSPDRRVAVVMLSNTAEAVDSTAMAVLDFILSEQL